MKHKSDGLRSCGMGVSPMRATTLHGRDAHATRKAFLLLAPALAFLVATGCQEPNDRTEVTGNGEGGVEIRHVPKDPSETAPQPARAATRSPLEQRVEVLEATVLRQQDQITTLRRELSARNFPTTSP